MKVIIYNTNKVFIVKKLYKFNKNAIYTILLLLSLISFQTVKNFKIKSKSRTQLKTTSSESLADGEDKSKPLSLNITYEHPYHDIEEQRKYADQHILFVRRTKEVENKLTTEIENLKMLMNVQNIQIQKINEIFYTNLAVLYQKLANDYKQKYIEHKAIKGFKDGEVKAKKKLDTVKVDFNDKKSLDEFKGLLIDKGVIKPEHLGEENERSRDLFVNVHK
jgi:hypothetical protein